VSARELALQATRLCLGPEPSEAQLRELGDPRIWRLYRELIRGRLKGEARAALPRSLELMGEASFERAFERWLLSAPPRSRAFYGVAIELAEHLCADTELPELVRDALRYESTQRLVANLEERVAVQVGELELDAIPVLNPTLRLLALSHALHEPQQAEGSYRRAPTRLLLHRRLEETRVRTTVLTAVTFALFERFLAQQETILDAVRAVAIERKLRVDDAFLDGLCTVLADLHESGALLGSVASRHST
jgi:hypothetical protein